jgi:hypothetical protein
VGYFAARGTYLASPNLFVFLQPSYVKLEVNEVASSMDVSAKEDDWKTRFGGGVDSP